MIDAESACMGTVEQLARKPAMTTSRCCLPARCRRNLATMTATKAAVDTASACCLHPRFLSHSSSLASRPERASNRLSVRSDERAQAREHAQRAANICVRLFASACVCARSFCALRIRRRRRRCHQRPAASVAATTATAAAAAAAAVYVRPASVHRAA